ncbi:hypothetical protein CEXT_362701, partial [Caerostris extrusa]
SAPTLCCTPGAPDPRDAGEGCRVELQVSDQTQADGEMVVSVSAGKITVTGKTASFHAAMP